jgi:hypothetical protein
MKAKPALSGLAGLLIAATAFAGDASAPPKENVFTTRPLGIKVSIKMVGPYMEAEQIATYGEPSPRNRQSRCDCTRKCDRIRPENPRRVSPACFGTSRSRLEGPTPARGRMTFCLLHLAPAVRRPWLDQVTMYACTGSEPRDVASLVLGQIS